MIVMALAVHSGRRWLVPFGLFVAGAGTLLKLEAMLLLCVVLLPWAFRAFETLPSKSTAWHSLVAVTLGLLPTVLWRLTLEVDNPVYAWPTWSGFLEKVPALPGIYLACIKLVIKGNLLLLLTLLPVVATAYAQRAGVGSFGMWLVPASIWACLAGLPVIYLFSSLPHVQQIQTSFLRLLFLPTFSATLLLFEVIRLTSGDPGSVKR